MKIRDLAIMFFVGFTLYAIFRDELYRWTWVVLALSALGMWWLFFMPTYCDQVLVTNNKRQCSTREIRGKLRGCWQHRRDKRDAVFAFLRVRNPGMLFRFAWSADSDAPLITPTTTIPENKVLRETWTLILTAVGTVAGVASAIFAVVYK